VRFPCPEVPATHAYVSIHDTLVAAIASRNAFFDALKRWREGKTFAQLLTLSYDPAELPPPPALPTLPMALGSALVN
jgi:hypothetical protein